MIAHRDALLAAVLPPSPGGLPGFGSADRAAFWTRFEAAAPTHLRLGVVVAVVILGVLWPTLRAGRPLRRLPAARQDALVSAAATAPLLGDLVEIVRLVACFAVFDDGVAQAALEAS